ncbi:MAG TPA: GPW/gp25 family protein [Terrimicrobiaceae bacterium]
MTAIAHRIRFPFAINPLVGRLRQETDYDEYIRQLIKQVIFTTPGERINLPQFGGGVQRLIFAPNSLAGASLAQTLVFQALTTSLNTLIKVNDVKTENSEEKLLITIDYTVLQRGERRFLNVEVTR